VLLHDEPCGRLTTLASRGYGERGIGAEVAMGQGLIGTAARDRQVLRFSMLDSDLSYGRAIRREAAGDKDCHDIPLPGLPDARSVLVIPLMVGDRLIGVLSAESRDPMRFEEWHEAYLQIIGNQMRSASIA
jgi:GAF domain-containing protein